MERLDLNAATARQLSNFLSLEPSFANEVIAYRRKRAGGRFNTMMDIWKVKGMNRQLYKLIWESCVIDKATSSVLKTPKTKGIILTHVDFESDEEDYDEDVPPQVSSKKNRSKSKQKYVAESPNSTRKTKSHSTQTPDGDISPEKRTISTSKRNRSKSARSSSSSRAKSPKLSATKSIPSAKRPASASVTKRKRSVPSTVKADQAEVPARAKLTPGRARRTLIDDSNRTIHPAPEYCDLTRGPLVNTRRNGEVPNSRASPTRARSNTPKRKTTKKSEKCNATGSCPHCTCNQGQIPNHGFFANPWNYPPPTWSPYNSSFQTISSQQPSPTVAPQVQDAQVQDVTTPPPAMPAVVNSPVLDRVKRQAKTEIRIEPKSVISQESNLPKKPDLKVSPSGNKVTVTYPFANRSCVRLPETLIVKRSSIPVTPEKGDSEADSEHNVHQKTSPLNQKSLSIHQKEGERRSSRKTIQKWIDNVNEKAGNTDDVAPEHPSLLLAKAKSDPTPSSSKKEVDLVQAPTRKAPSPKYIKVKEASTQAVPPKVGKKATKSPEKQPNKSSEKKEKTNRRKSDDAKKEKGERKGRSPTKKVDGKERSRSKSKDKRSKSRDRKEESYGGCRMM